MPEMTPAELEALLALPITPGPWVVSHDASGDTFISGADFQYVADIAWRDDELPCDPANAAPTLLSALAEARAEVAGLISDIETARQFVKETDAENERSRSGLSDLIDHVEAINSEWDANALQEARAALEGSK